MLHGAYLVIHRLIITKFPILHEIKFFKSRIGKIVSIFITQYLVFLAWIAFRVRDTDNMLYSMSKYVFLDFQTVQTLEFIDNNTIAIGILLTFIIFNFISYRQKNLINIISKFTMWKWTLFLISIIVPILLFYTGTTNDFIYFQF